MESKQKSVTTVYGWRNSDSMPRTVATDLLNELTVRFNGSEWVSPDFLELLRVRGDIRKVEQKTSRSLGQLRLTGTDVAHMASISGQVVDVELRRYWADEATHMLDFWDRKTGGRSIPIECWYAVEAAMAFCQGAYTKELMEQNYEVAWNKIQSLGDSGFGFACAAAAYSASPTPYLHICDVLLRAMELTIDAEDERRFRGHPYTAAKTRFVIGLGAGLLGAVRVWMPAPGSLESIARSAEAADISGFVE